MERTDGVWNAYGIACTTGQGLRAHCGHRSLAGYDSLDGLINEGKSTKEDFEPQGEIIAQGRIDIQRHMNAARGSMAGHSRPVQAKASGPKPKAKSKVKTVTA